VRDFVGVPSKAKRNVQLSKWPTRYAKDFTADARFVNVVAAIDTVVVGRPTVNVTARFLPPRASDRSRQ